MPSGYGRSFGGGLDFEGFDRKPKKRAAGIYRSARDFNGQSGGANYPTVLEAYERDSSYKRWRAGWDYWQGGEKSWADFTREYRVVLFRDFGSESSYWRSRVTYFPSDSSPDASWTVATRLRGAIILPQPLRREDISFDVSGLQAETHRLILDVSSSLDAGQLAHWEDLIGDQFEDSAMTPTEIITDPSETIAYTLTAVDKEEGRLLFDVSRPFARFRPDPLKPRAFWRKVPYEFANPLPWSGNGSRYLCSSHRFFCSCPDFSGRRLADLVAPTGARQEVFPVPGAGRSVADPEESREVGYMARFRDLANRSDRRRECKHIHAVRFSLGYPFFEPSDYPLTNSYTQFYRGTSDRLSPEEILRYHKLRRLTLDRLAIPLAEANGVLSTPGDLIGSDTEAPAQPDRRPVLWNLPDEPAAFRAQPDDWWIQRGTQKLRIFNAAVGRFVASAEVGGIETPVLLEEDPGSS